LAVDKYANQIFDAPSHGLSGNEQDAGKQRIAGLAQR
jgi:hypothetical protein